MASTVQFEIEATVRSDIGKGASRRLRRDDKVPGIIYGAGQPATSITFEHKKIAKSLEQEAFYSHILTLKTDSNSEMVILKDVQRHPYKARILHVDFQRVRSDQKLHMNVPLHFTGGDMAPGAKEAGGIISHIETNVEISCLPADLPEFIPVDISNMQLNDILHLSDLKLPKGVELVALAHGDDKPVISIHIPRVVEEPEITEAVAASEVPALEQKAEGADTSSEEK